MVLRGYISWVYEDETQLRHFGKGYLLFFNIQFGAHWDRFKKADIQWLPGV